MSNDPSVKSPQVGRIVISGPVQSGKSIVLDRIARFLESDFGATVGSRALQTERNLGLDSTNLEDWEKKLVRETNWVLEEDNDKESTTPCQMCLEDPQPTNFDMPRRCAFASEGEYDNWACRSLSLLREEFEEYFRHRENPSSVLTYLYNRECEQTSVFIDVGDVDWGEGDLVDEPIVLVLSWYKDRGAIEAFYLIVNGHPPRLPTEKEFFLILDHVKENRPSK